MLTLEDSLDFGESSSFIAHTLDSVYLFDNCAKIPDLLNEVLRRLILLLLVAAEPDPSVENSDGRISVGTAVATESHDCIFKYDCVMSPSSIFTSC